MTKLKHTAKKLFRVMLSISQQETVSRSETERAKSARVRQRPHPFAMDNRVFSQDQMVEVILLFVPVCMYASSGFSAFTQEQDTQKPIPPEVNVVLPEGSIAFLVGFLRMFSAMNNHHIAPFLCWDVCAMRY